MRTYHLLDNGKPAGRLLLDDSDTGYAVLDCLPKPLTVVPKAPGDSWTRTLSREHNKTQADLARVERELGKLLAEGNATGTPREEVSRLKQRRSDLTETLGDQTLVLAHLRRERRRLENCIRLASAKENGSGLG